MTAKHCTIEHPELTCRYQDENETPCQVRLDAAARIDHPGGLIDVAAYEMERAPQAFADLIFLANSQSLEQANTGNGTPVFITGLLFGLSGRDRNLPIVRLGSIARMPNEPIATRYGSSEAFLVETHSTGGLSGSPVFARYAHQQTEWYSMMPNKAVYSTESYLLIGVVVGHWETFVEAGEPLRVNTGIAIVIPAWRIREGIDEALKVKRC